MEKGVEGRLDFSAENEPAKRLDFAAENGSVKGLDFAAENGSVKGLDFAAENEPAKRLDFPTIMDEFSLECPDAAGYSSLALAYIGDCVYDLVIRTLVVGQNHTSVNDLHHKTIHFVKAESQADAADALVEYLTPEEADIYRRARNAKSNTKAKNASIVAYRKATGLEAVIGYLYIQNKTDRILELMSLALGSAGR
ncbi:MAG: ribonuclease III [Lachnospiraceae bacterium]|nr:ribonuclease III [Lachnospiraceae bacterium]